VSVLSLPSPASLAAAPAFAHGSRKLAVPGRPVDRAALAHHLAVLPISARSLALLTGSAPGDRPADALLARWVSVRLRSLAAALVAGEASASTLRHEVSGLLGLGPDPAPAGEEALVGVAAAARRLAVWRLLPEPAVAALGGALAASGPEAAETARRAFSDAARGGFPQPVAAVVDLLGVADAEDGALKEAVLRLTAGGSRPGADALAGIVAVVREVALGSL